MGGEVEAEDGDFCCIDVLPKEEVDGHRDDFVLYSIDVSVEGCFELESGTESVGGGYADVPMGGLFGAEVICSNMIKIQFIEGGHTEDFLPHQSQVDALRWADGQAERGGPFVIVLGGGA